MCESSQADPSSPARVVMLSGDLLFASKVKAAAERGGFAFQISGSLPEEPANSIRFVVLDLSTRSGLTDKIVEQCADRCPDARLIAYGPHVHVGKLQAARDAGIETVMTNGQFDRQMSELFG